MATNTTNLSLIKPDANDFYNIEDFNKNFEKIDKAFGDGVIFGDGIEIGDGAGAVYINGGSITLQTIIDVDNKRYLSISSMDESDISNSLILANIVDGVANYYRLYGEHNKPTATDIGAAPSGFGLGSLCKNIDNQDIVAIARSGQSGFYAGANVTNAPDTAYHMYLVICFSNQASKVLCFDFYNLFIKMAAISFDTWTGWKSVVETTVVPASVE